MRWFKKIVRAILNLLPVFILSLLFVNNTFASQHQYMSIPLYTPPAPELQYNSSTGKFELTGSFRQANDMPDTSVFQNHLQISWTSDNYDESFSNSSTLKQGQDSRFVYFVTKLNNNNCEYFQNSSFYPRSQFSAPYTLNGNYYVTSETIPGIPEDSYVTDYSTTSGKCYRLSPFGEGNLSLNESTLPIIYNSNDQFFTDFRKYYRDNLSPYYYSTDGFYASSSAVNDSNGITYNHSFSFNDLFGYNVTKFRHLQFSLFDEKQIISYTQGREIEYKGVFTSASPFNISQTAEDYGHFYIRFEGWTDSNQFKTTNIQCTLNNRSLPALDSYMMEYSCPWVVDADYLFTYQTFHIDAIPNDTSIPSSYVWDTATPWYWSGQTGAGLYVVTDNDTTPGEPLNTVRTGTDIPGDATHDFPASGSTDIIIDGANYSQSLINLFGFTFINPFSPLFNLFNSGDSCVQIPTVAGMIHSESTQVCPWFDSTVRNIVTPVLGISSMMLVFGFAVRWLGASSGNMFEDSGTHSWGRYNFKQKGGS